MASYDSIPPTAAASHLFLGYAKKAGFCAAIGLAFGAGLIVSKIESPKPEADSGDLLALAKERDDKFTRVKEELALRYHEELIENNEDEVERARLVKKPSAKKTPAPKTPPKSEAQQGSHGPKEVALKSESQKIAPAAPAKKTPSKVAMNKTVALEDSEDADNETSKKRMEKAFLDVMGESAPAIVKEDVVPKVNTSEQKNAGGFTVQLGSFPSMSSAKAMATSFKRKGYSAQVREGVASGRATFRVQVGSFSDRKSALASRKKIEASEGILTIVVPF